MGNLIDFKEKKAKKDLKETNVLRDIDTVFRHVSTNELAETCAKAKDHFKSIGYIVQSSNKFIDKKKFPPKKTILFREINIGFSTTIKKKFTNDSWVIYPVQIEPVNGFIELVTFIQHKIEASKDGREKQSNRS
ncbi:hypothetical protein OI909_10045 [Enterobacter asburiae]|uniref:hypothetical protein n=1 Tax=Enterobacter asburiae TaxID=61645 RepID=UPI0025426B46|nr:hypothetical protein [Enterobacter asburiae]ELQ7874772.1 hypothetical protein [Enterobacter asburiae]ELR9542816.1 hypothetical protein [Enterobacter asburiae]WIK26254.1 hypothetical protein OI909_10045 [Enterobacter asburiae]